jgi:catechol 2,3-dioxygenase-like lactoylglutathione lyase family enzyme
MDWKLEVVLLPVSDVDASKAFYSEVLGFTLDVDHHPNDQFRVVQLTPPGSACSITFGIGLSDAAPGSYRGTHLVVDDIEAAHAHLSGRGVAVNGPYHFGPEGRAEGLHPERVDFGTFLDFADPDGNTWIVQERDHTP